MSLSLPLYETFDATDYWPVTIYRHVQKDLGMNPMAGDRSLYHKDVNGNVEGLLGKHFDQELISKTQDLQSLYGKH